MVIKKINKILQRGANSKNENRSFVVRKNALQSIVFKGINIGVSLLLIPLSIKFVGKDEYGIWLTISSMIVFLSLLDIGFTNGLRNNLVEALSLGKYKLARIFVSTTYVFLGIVFLLVLLLFLLINPLIDWSGFLNLSFNINETLIKVVAIIFSYFCFSFLLKMINTVLFADQKAGYSSLIDMFGQLLSLLAIFVMSLLFKGTLLLLCVGLCLMPIIVALVFNVVLFRGRYRKIAPSFKYFRVWSIKKLMGLSVKFFVIQSAALIQYQTANIVIARLFSIGEVTNYNIAFRYFSVLSLFFGIIMLPLWSAVTEAYNKNDFFWIRNIVKKYLKLFFLLLIVGVLMLFVSDQVYFIWIEKWTQQGIIAIPFGLSAWCLIYTLTLMFGGIFVNVLNGIGAVKIQFVFSFITPFIYLSLCFFFISYLGWGIYSVFIAAIISNVNGFIVAPFQYCTIFYRNKKGIWVA